MRRFWKRRRSPDLILGGPEALGVALNGARKGETVQVAVGPRCRCVLVPTLTVEWDWPQRPVQGIEPAEYDAMTIREAEWFHGLVALGMSTGFDRGYSERQALAIVQEARRTADSAGLSDSVSEV